jgi:hypothetical protein
LFTTIRGLFATIRGLFATKGVGQVDTARHLLLLVHLLGFGALFGGAVVQVRDHPRVVNAAMLYGIATQIVSGIALVGVIEGQHGSVDHAKIAVKFAVGLVVGLLCWANRSRPALPTGLYWMLAALVVANAGVAVLWT